MYAIFCDTPGIGITNYSISYPIIQIFSGHLSLKKYLTIATDISTDGFFKKICDTSLIGIVTLNQVSIIQVDQELYLKNIFLYVLAAYRNYKKNY